MSNVSQGLFTGSIIPWERPNISSAQQLEISCKIDEQERYFSETLSPEDQKRFEALSLLYMSLAEIEENNVFSYGFSLGMLLMLDVLEQEKRMIAKR